MRLRTAKDRDILEALLSSNPAIRSVVPGVTRPVRDARGKIRVPQSGLFSLRGGGQ